MSIRGRRINAPSGLWIALLVVPTALNAALWFGVVAPQRGRLHTWQDAQRLAEVKPNLEAAVAKSQALLRAWDQSGFSSNDPMAVTQAIRRLSAAHRIELTAVETQATAERTAGRHTTVPVEVKARGRFNALARWISDVEAQAGLQLESWTIAPTKDSGTSHELAVKMTAFLRGA